LPEDVGTCTVTYESPLGVLQDVPLCAVTEPVPTLQPGQQRCFAYRDPSPSCVSTAAGKVVFLSTHALEEEAYLLDCGG
jgi:hypothetical protein